MVQAKNKENLSGDQQPNSYVTAEVLSGPNSWETTKK